jgi:hypothetical protein
VLKEPLCEEDLVPLENAMKFHAFYQGFRDRFATMAPIYGFAQAWGDWGAARAADVDGLIGDGTVPLRLQRNIYLVNLIRGDFGEPEWVDFYSVNYHPLFRAALRMPRGRTGAACEGRG